MSHALKDRHILICTSIQNTMCIFSGRPCSRIHKQVAKFWVSLELESFKGGNVHDHETDLCLPRLKFMCGTEAHEDIKERDDNMVGCMLT